MNMHVPQSVLAETELRNLAAIPYQVISPAGNAPIIGIYQDSLLGSYRFTRPNIKLTPREAMNLLMNYKNVDVKAIMEKKDGLSSFDVLSQIIPPISLMYKTKLFEDGEDMKTSNNVLEIRNGKYVRGQLEKAVLGSSTKGIIHRIFNDYGCLPSTNFIDDLQSIIVEYMKASSFSVGISDLVSDKNTYSQIIQVINDQKSEVQTVIDEVHMGTFKNETAYSNNTEFETRVNNLLNKATDKTGKIGRTSLSKSNRFVMIVNSGSKGSPLNISQMISCLGQQNVDGKRIPYGFDSRTLPHYTKFDDSPNARGFVENSYIAGLTAPELFFHAMGGRVGLIDTACKTSSTGYIQRRLIKGLEDLKVEYDMTVRNSKGKIVQFSYGDDSFDTSKVETQHIPLVEMSIEDIYMHYDIIGLNDYDSDLLDIYSKGTISRMKKQRDETKEKCKHYINTMIKYRDIIVQTVFKNKNDSSVKLPVAFNNIIQNIQGQLNLNANSVVDITPLEAFELVESYFEKMKQIKCAPPTKLFEIMYYLYLTPKNLLVNKRFNRKALLILLETVLLRYKQAIVHPGEMVGVVAGQSIGEPTTQLTLNSVTYETEILVRNSAGRIECYQIGDFTKKHMANSKKLDYMQEKDTTYAELNEFYEVPSTTKDGDVVWRRIEAVTQHPVINEDGSNTMLKFTTKGLREIIVTKAKSLLKLVDGKVIESGGDKFKVGDYLLVSRKQLDYTPQKTLDLKEILPPTEYIYGSEIEKARTVMNERYWWADHHGKLFTLPHNRSDSARESIIGSSNRRVNKIIYEPGFVYTKINNISNYKIPENIELDYDFGYFIGAYCAEGCITKHQISIANNEYAYFEPILRLCAKYNITTKHYVHNNKCQEGWTSSDLRIYSTILTNLLEKLCGKLSHNKHIDDRLIYSNEECARGIIDAYIGGDGSVTTQNRCVTSNSVSKRLLEDIQLLLSSLNINSKLYKGTMPTSNNRGTLPENFHQPYIIRICNSQCVKLCSILNTKIAGKQERAKEIIDTYKPAFVYSKFDDSMFPNTDSKTGEVVMEPRDDRMMDLEFDKIVSIEEVSNTTNYAYDLTVEDTRNFNCRNAVNLRDTFHSAGHGTKSNVTRGVPRIEEILRLTSNPKNPSATVYMKPLDQCDQDKAIKFSNMLEYTKLIDVVKSVQICFDPNEKTTLIEEDKVLLEQYYEFEQLIQDCISGAVDDEVELEKSKWIIRMEIDPELLLDKNITMDDIHFALKNSPYGIDINCVFSDYNMDKLIFRIKTNAGIFNKGKRRGAPDTLDQSDEIYLLKNFQDSLLKNIVLRGIGGIQNVLPRKLQNTVVKEDGKFVRKDTWILDTTGSNLLELFALDFIDYKRTFSNDIKEVYDVLGIQAARQMIYNEFVEVMDHSDVYIDYHHLSLLCDRMTNTKDMVSIYRSGILNDDIGPIGKSTFEVHTEVLLDAARHAEFDHMRGVSATVMMGQTGYFGTNAFNLVMDMKEVEHMDDAEASVENKEDTIESMFKVGDKDTDQCSRRNIEIKNNIQHIKINQHGICDDDYDMGL